MSSNNLSISSKLLNLCHRDHLSILVCVCVLQGVGVGRQGVLVAACAGARLGTENALGLGQPECGCRFQAVRLQFGMSSEGLALR